MRDRGKAPATTYGGGGVGGLSDEGNNYYSSSSTTSDLPCRRHPGSSSAGICAQCLKDRLIRLVCSDCGEQRLSSCSCSDFSTSNRNSCTVEVGSVGRVSFLIENENPDLPLPLLHPQPPSEVVPIQLRRSSYSTSVDVKQQRSGGGGFWKIGKIFGKKTGTSKKNAAAAEDEEEGGCDEVWENNNGVVSRCRSLCSFVDDDDLINVSAPTPRVSAVNGSASLFSDLDRTSRRMSDAEPRKSGFDVGEKVPNGVVSRPDSGFDCLKTAPGNVNGANRRVFSLRESEFGGGGGGGSSGFIDLKFGSEAKPGGGRLARLKMGARSVNASAGFAAKLEPDHRRGYSGSFDGGFAGGGSCRISVNDRGPRKSKRSTKVWRWIFGHHH